MYSAWSAELADCVAWERGGCAETRAVANNAVSRVTSFYLCACFSHPRPVIVRLQEFPRSPPHRRSTAYPSHKHSSSHKHNSSSHNHSHHPTKHRSTQQENVRECVYKRLNTGARCHAWHVSKRKTGQRCSDVKNARATCRCMT